MKLNRRKVLGWAVELTLVLALVAGIQYWRTRDAKSGPAPVLEVSAIGGESFHLSDGQGPSLVHFWGIWCPICQLEEGTIDSLARDHRVITVALASGSDKEILAYMRDAGLDFPVINDDSGRIAEQWGVAGVPTSFVVNAAGEVVFVTSGYTTGLGLRARLWLAED
jgi:thiol-disulfide isomerase/thioredoxin